MRLRWQRARTEVGFCLRCPGAGLGRAPTGPGAAPMDESGVVATDRARQPVRGSATAFGRPRPRPSARHRPTDGLTGRAQRSALVANPDASPEPACWAPGPHCSLSCKRAPPSRALDMVESPDAAGSALRARGARRFNACRAGAGRGAINLAGVTAAAQRSTVRSRHQAPGTRHRAPAALRTTDSITRRAFIKGCPVRLGGACQQTRSTNPPSVRSSRV